VISGISIMNIEALDLNLLPAFEALMAERHVSRAGQRIGLSQPAMSNALARLRKIFDDRLFVPAGREMAPTSRALQLAPLLLEALGKVRTAIGDQRIFDPKSANLTFRIGATDYAEMVLLSRSIRSLRAAAPAIRITTLRLSGLFEIPSQRLADSSLDFAVGLFPQPIVPGTGIALQLLFDDDWVCVARRGHPQIQQKMTLQKFLRLEHIRVSYGIPEKPGLIGEALAGIGRSRKVGVTVPHLTTVPAIAARSDLVGVVPRLLAEESRQALRLSIYPIPLRLPRTTMALLWHERNQQNPAHAWLRNTLRGLTSQMQRKSGCSGSMNSTTK
jgi:DNA-binding transcriptional LysR family regulator